MYHIAQNVAAMQTQGIATLANGTESKVQHQQAAL